jgi:hypothetical protein
LSIHELASIVLAKQATKTKMVGRMCSRVAAPDRVVIVSPRHGDLMAYGQVGFSRVAFCGKSAQHLFASVLALGHLRMRHGQIQPYQCGNHLFI